MWNIVDNNLITPGNPSRSGIYLVFIDNYVRQWTIAAYFNHEIGCWTHGLEVDKLDLYYLKGWMELPCPPESLVRVGCHE